MSLKSPVLFIIFNRPHCTKMVFEKIRAAKPPRLYIAADGPRENHFHDIENCSNTRLICKQIDWDCELNILYQERNIGCKSAVIAALKWFFEKEDMGIILEDDCVPDVSFFLFCDEMLAKYKDDEKIFSINGSNLGYDLKDGNSYSFARFMNMWGWASWRRCAAKIDYDLVEWTQEKAPLYTMYKRLRQHVFDLDIHWYKYWKHKFDCIAFDKWDTWDWQWIYYQTKSKQLSIIPAVNLVNNIGFNEDATHTQNADNLAAGLPTRQIDLPCIHPVDVKPGLKYEEDYVKWIWCYHKRLPRIFYLKYYLSGMINKWKKLQ